MKSTVLHDGISDHSITLLHLQNCSEQIYDDDRIMKIVKYDKFREEMSRVNWDEFLTENVKDTEKLLI